MLLNRITTWMQYNWGVILILITLFGFISKSLYNYPFLLMAIIGLTLVVKDPALFFKNKFLKYYTLAFLCLWLPLLISLPDSVNYSHSANTVFPYLRFLFAGIFIISQIKDYPERLNHILTGVFFISVFWVFDALLQFFTGYNLLGYSYVPGNLFGMFYPGMTLGHICAFFSPLYFHYIYIQKKHLWLSLLIIPLVIIIFLSGRRAAWLMLFVSIFGYSLFLYLKSSNKKVFFQRTLFFVSLVCITIVTTAILHKPIYNRIMVTKGLFSDNYILIDQATANRLPIWETAISIAQENPINGIGPRGFRYAYQEYSSPDNLWQSQTHPHQIILEILAETGLIGLIGYFLFIFLILKILQKSKFSVDHIPYCLPIILAVFPLNAHKAFYGSIISSVLWLMTALYFSRLAIENE